MQLAKATAALANKGKIIRPRLVSSTSNSISSEIKVLPSFFEEPITMTNNKHWDDIIASMKDVVHGVGGTAWRSGLNAKYKFAGKTGTAQVIGIARTKNIKKKRFLKSFRITPCLLHLHR